MTPGVEVAVNLHTYSPAAAEGQHRGMAVSLLRPAGAAPPGHLLPCHLFSSAPVPQDPVGFREECCSAFLGGRNLRAERFPGRQKRA